MNAPLLTSEVKARAIAAIKSGKPILSSQSRSIAPWRRDPKNALVRFPSPASKFAPGITTRQNRFNEHGHTKIKVFHHKHEGVTMSKTPVLDFEQEQIKQLDPTGQRTAMFAKNNIKRVRPGDILLVRLKTGDPFSGVCLSIRQRHAKVDWAILLRNHLTRIATEMWFKIYSPNIEGIEIVQRAQRKARRLRLYYMRKPKHDIGSVEGVVRQYMRRKAGVETQQTPAVKAKLKKKAKKN